VENRNGGLVLFPVKKEAKPQIRREKKEKKIVNSRARARRKGGGGNSIPIRKIWQEGPSKAFRDRETQHQE